MEAAAFTGRMAANSIFRQESLKPVPLPIVPKGSVPSNSGRSRIILQLITSGANDEVSGIAGKSILNSSCTIAFGKG